MNWSFVCSCIANAPVIEMHSAVAESGKCCAGVGVASKHQHCTEMTKVKGTERGNCISSSNN